MVWMKLFSTSTSANWTFFIKKCLVKELNFIWAALWQNQQNGMCADDKWVGTWQNQQSDRAPSKDSDQPGHLPSLIRIFAVRMKKAWVLSYPLRAQWRLWSDWADAQADLSLHWAHMSFCWFWHEAAHLQKNDRAKHKIIKGFLAVRPSLPWSMQNAVKFAKICLVRSCSCTLRTLRQFW